MSKVSTYLHFAGTAEQAFNFYRSVFGGEFSGPIHRFAEAPEVPGRPPLSEADKKLVMHVELPILAGHVLMGTDSPESMGVPVYHGNDVHISLEPDSRAETERLFEALAEGGSVDMPLQPIFWGAYFGSLTDRFGICWMFNCRSKV